MKREALSAFLLLLGLACSLGPSDEEAVRMLYGAYREAVKSADPDRIRPFVSSEKQKEITGPDIGLKLRMIVELMPAEVQVLKTTISGREAVLEAEGRKDGQKMTGTVRLVKEGRGWRIDKEDWSMRVDLAAEASLGQAAAFFPDPQRAPQAHAVLEGHQGEVSKLAFTPDGRYLVSASYGDYSIRTWRLDSGAPVSEVRAESRVMDLALSPDGRAVFTADVGKNVHA